MSFFTTVVAGTSERSFACVHGCYLFAFLLPSKLLWLLLFPHAQGLIDQQVHLLDLLDVTDVMGSLRKNVLDIVGQASMIVFPLVMGTEVCMGCDGIELGWVVFDHAKPVRGLAQLGEFCSGSLFVVCQTKVCLEVGFKSHIICGAGDGALLGE